MKYILITKVENSDPIKKEYSSLRKIAQDLETTYCSCYSNFLDSVEPTRKPSKKLSQIMFNKKYKISKSNLKEFFGLFGKKKPQTLQSIIDADPVLQKLDNEMGDIVKSFAPRVRKIADEQPELYQKWVKLGIIDKDFK